MLACLTSIAHHSEKERRRKEKEEKEEKEYRIDPDLALLIKQASQLLVSRNSGVTPAPAT